VTHIVLVFRTFPIRVAGEQAGPMKDEITWEIIQKESGYPYPIEEFTTVTKKRRRVARFDYDLAVKATQVNRPTLVAINGLDYLDFGIRSLKDSALLSRRPCEFLARLSGVLNVPIAYCGTGPGLDEIAVHERTAHGLLTTS